MLREVALRRALQGARDRRQREFDEIQERGRVLRRRLRELTDHSLALGSVHGRFVPEEPSPEPGAVEPAAPQAAPEPFAPAPPPAAAPAAPSVSVLRPPPRPEEGHEKLIATLFERYREGFTVGQMREVLDEVEPGRIHSYDAAWSLANTLMRAQLFELAGSRPGPAAPIRILRVVPKAVPAASAEV